MERTHASYRLFYVGQSLASFVALMAYGATLPREPIYRARGATRLALRPSAAYPGLYAAYRQSGVPFTFIPRTPAACGGSRIVEPVPTALNCTLPRQISKAGRLALLLHGFPENRLAWEAQMGTLTRLGYSVWMPDQRRSAFC